MSCTFCMTWSLSHGRLHLSKCTDVLMTAEGILAAVWPLLGHPSMGAWQRGGAEALCWCSAKAYPLDALLQDCQKFLEVTGRRVTFEYTLLAGVNGLPCSGKHSILR